MFLVIGIYFLSFILSCFHTPQKLNPSNYLNYISPMPIAYALIFYSFRLIKNEEQKFFKMLSIMAHQTFSWVAPSYCGHRCSEA